jgi:hypothetical protein
MTRTERLTERAIGFAIAEADEDLAVARLAFLAQEDLAALDKRWTRAWPAAATLCIPAGVPSASWSGSATGPADVGSAGRFQRQPLK